MATAAMFLIVVFLWRDQSRLKSDMVEMAEQNDQLREALAVAQSKLDDFKTGIPAKKETTPSTQVTAEPPVEEPETLMLQQPSVSQTPVGLATRLEFKPTTSELPDLIALVVRLPRESEAEILELKAVPEKAFPNAKIRVDESGKFAVFQGSPANLKALEFDLTVTAPVKAVVRGSKGIKPFEIIIDSSGAIVHEL